MQERGPGPELVARLSSLANRRARNPDGLAFDARGRSRSLANAVDPDQSRPSEAGGTVAGDRTQNESVHAPASWCPGQSR